MANTVIAIRSSGVTGNTPSLGVLANGELSLNFADGVLFYKSSSNTLGSIRTTQVAGLNTEVQFNDSGSFGSNSNFSFNKSIATLNVKNINVSTNLVTTNLTATYLTTGSGAGGSIAGANIIYSNTFVANSGGITTTGNSSLNGIVTVNYNVGAASSQNAAIEMYGANTKGGTGYFDFIYANNKSAGTTNQNKWFRLDSNGKFQIINSAYTTNIFDLNDSGYLTVPGGIATSQYIQFADGSKQYTANAGAGGGGVTQIVAGTNVTISPAGGTGVVTINSTGGGGGSTDYGFGQIFTSNNSTYANAASANDKVTFVGDSGIYVYSNATTKTITFAGGIQSLPGAQGMTVDYGYVSEAVYYNIDYGTL
jgi:hypothetical protein